MRAGQHDDVGLRVRRAVEERRQDAAQPIAIDGFAQQLRLRHVDQLRRPDAQHRAIGGVALDQVVGVGPVDGGGRRQQADDLALALLRRRLDRGHHADHRDAGRGAQLRQADGADGVAGGDDEVGLHAIDRAVHHVEEMRQQLGIGPRAIGKERVVAQIGEARLRQRLADLGDDGEAAQAGIGRKIVGPESAARMTGAAASLMRLFGRQSGGRGERLADQTPPSPCAHRAR